MPWFRKIWILIELLMVFAFSSCNTIDDDLSNCPPEPSPTEDFELNYELKLVTNMTTELQTQLNTVTEVEISDALKQHLTGVFRSFAHDVDLSFYDVAVDSLRLHHESHIMDDHQSSYTLNLPMREYMHLASANIVDNSLVSMQLDDYCHTARLSQAEADSIASHETGIFTARAYMDVLDNVDQTFDVKLFMSNAAAALVVDTTGVKYKSFRAYAHGFATGFQVADSIYTYEDHSPYVRANQVALSDSLNQVAYCTVNFPSRNPKGWWMREKTDSLSAVAHVSKTPSGFAITRGEGEIIPEGDSDGETLWEYIVYVTLEDGSITKTTLEMKEPLLAGAMKIIKGRMDTKGIVQPTDAKVGMSVTLDWQSGMGFEEEL